MALSVIITSYESPETLRCCLESLVRQIEAAEIVVSDCSSIDPAQALQALFPAVRFLHFDEPRSVPLLRWVALPLTTADVIAVTEARCIPSETWCGELLAAHSLAPESPAVGGTVILAGGASSFDSALYFCEYGAYAPPAKEGPAGTISGANLSYRRTALCEGANQINFGEWETRLHRRWVSEGRQLWQSRASVTFHNSMSIPDSFRQRWHYGRGYAADRVIGSRWPIRLGLGTLSLGLPILLLGRVARDCADKGMFAQFLRSFGWTLALTIAWSWGETAGYLGGKPAASRIF